MSHTQRSPGTASGGAIARWARNPFFVLELPTSASSTEVERAARKWLALLEMETSDGTVYATPVGPQTRTTELVRAAAAQLRDPAQRLVHEVWARAPLRDAPLLSQAAPTEADRALRRAALELGGLHGDLEDA